MTKARASLLMLLFLFAGCSGVFQSKMTIVEIVINTENGVDAGKPQANALRHELNSHVKRWPAVISRRERIAVEKYISKIEGTHVKAEFNSKYKDPVLKPFDTEPMKIRLSELHRKFDPGERDLSARMANDREINRTNAEISLEAMLGEVEVQIWRIQTDTALLKSQFENQRTLYEKQLEVNQATERVRMRQELLQAGAEVKACFPRATRKVLKK